MSTNSAKGNLMRLALFIFSVFTFFVLATYYVLFRSQPLSDQTVFASQVTAVLVMGAFLVLYQWIKKHPDNDYHFFLVVPILAFCSAVSMMIAPHLPESGVLVLAWPFAAIMSLGCGFAAFIVGYTALYLAGKRFKLPIRYEKMSDRLFLGIPFAMAGVLISCALAVLGVSLHIVHPILVACVLLACGMLAANAFTGGAIQATYDELNKHLM